MGCEKGVLPSVYLGLPLSAKYKAKSVWDDIEEIFRRELALWKRSNMSKGGRLTLIKSTQSNLPIYTMSLFRIPKMVANRLEKIHMSSYGA